MKAALSCRNLFATIHLIVPSAVNFHDGLVMDLLLLFQSSFCLCLDALADIVDFEHLLLQGGVLIFQDFLSPAKLCPHWFEHGYPWCHSWIVLPMAWLLGS